jgi:hypothetical protein
MARIISDIDFEELGRCVEMLNLRLYEHRERDNPHGEALYEHLKSQHETLDSVPEVRGGFQGDNRPA